VISQRFAVMFGWVTVGVLLVLLALVWSGVIDASLRLPVLLLAVLLVISRLVLTMLTRRQSSGKSEGL